MLAANILFALIPTLFALNNGLARVPERGFNTWNVFRCGWTETIIHEVVDAFVSTGLSAAGYEYINLDGCELTPCPKGMAEDACHNYTRDADGTLHDFDLARLPSGAKAACDYIHLNKLKCGGYSDAAFTTCQNRPGSLFFEKQDADMWAEVGLDLFKVDNCGQVPPGWEKPELRYPRLRDALNLTGRPILYSLCVWGVDDPWVWGPATGNTWRMYDDSDLCDHTPGFGNGCWARILEITDAAVGLGKFAGPGGFNDLDILLVANGGMTFSEDMTHFFLWVITKSPLLLGNDVRTMDSETLALVTSADVLAISGDALGVGGDLVNRTCIIGGIETPCSSGVKEEYTTTSIYAATCVLGGTPSQTFNFDSAPYPNASATDQKITSNSTGECFALWDCVAPVVLYNCTQDSGSCSGAQMRHFEWIKIILNGDLFQIRSVMMPDSCLSVDIQSNTIVLLPCIHTDGTTWTENTFGQIRDFTTGFCIDVLKPPPTESESVDTWAVALAGGDRAALLVNRRSTPTNITLVLSTLGIHSASATVRDLFPSMSLGTVTESFTAEVEPHGSLFLRLSPVQGSSLFDVNWSPQPPPYAATKGHDLRSASVARRKAQSKSRVNG